MNEEKIPIFYNPRFTKEEYEALTDAMSQGYQILLSFKTSKTLSLIPQKIDNNPSTLQTQIEIKNKPRNIDEVDTLYYRFLDLNWFITRHFPRYTLIRFAYHVSTKVCLGFILEHQIGGPSSKERAIFLLDKPVWVLIPKSNAIEPFLTSANAIFSFLTFIKNEPEISAKFYFLNLSPEQESLREYITQFGKQNNQLRRIQALDASFCVI